MGDYAAPVNAKAGFDTWNTVYMNIAAPQARLLGLQVIKVGAGLPSLFYPPSAFAITTGQATLPSAPVADGLMLQGWGSPVTKGRSDWLLHCVSGDFLLNTNKWDLTLGGVTAAIAAGLAWFRQYRPVGPTSSGFPKVDPPVAFDTMVANEFIRLRRVGRLFQRGGQGLRTA